MLTIEQLKEAVPKHMKGTVTTELIDIINTALEDQEAMDIYKENLLSYTHVLQQGKFKLINYVNAVRYVGFKVMGYSNKDAYIKTFPDKYQRFISEGTADKDIASYMTAYNKSKLVNLIYAQTQIPVYILNAPILQQAINVQANLMLNAKSEMVRFNAANSLMLHLKPPEVAKIELDIATTKSSTLEEYEQAMTRLVEQQMELISKGGDIKQITNVKIKPLIDDDVIDVTPEPVLVANTVPNNLFNH